MFSSAICLRTLYFVLFWNTGSFSGIPLLGKRNTKAWACAKYISLAAMMLTCILFILYYLALWTLLVFFSTFFFSVFHLTSPETLSLSLYSLYISYGHNHFSHRTLRRVNDIINEVNSKGRSISCFYLKIT